MEVHVVSIQPSGPPDTSISGPELGALMNMVVLSPRVDRLLHRQVADAPLEEAEASVTEVKEVKSSPAINRRLQHFVVLSFISFLLPTLPKQEIADNLADDFVVTETAEAVEVAIAESTSQPVRATGQTLRRHRL